VEVGARVGSEWVQRVESRSRLVGVFGLRIFVPGGVSCRGYRDELKALLIYRHRVILIFLLFLAFLRVLTLLTHR